MAVVLFAPALAGAQARVAKSSGPFKIQIGESVGGQPVYADCGTLNLYKSSVAGGREWRLDDTCDQLIDVMVPTVAPTPTPGTVTPTPTPGPVGPTPTRSASSAECPDGFFSKLNSSQWVLNNITIQENKTHTWCVDLPASSRPFFEIYTVNKGNASCSDVELTAESPNGTEYYSNGSAPAVPPFITAGRWKIHLHLNYGCARYDVNIAY